MAGTIDLAVVYGWNIIRSSHGEWLELEHHCLGPITVCSTMTETPGHGHLKVSRSQGARSQCMVDV